jgi:PTH1 family peptidyl-tRNA hydrolase
MKLIIGLGNPDKKYIGTRHNVGFWVLNSIELTWKTSDRFRALISESIVSDEKVIYAKPTTYYNLVGESARALMDYYKLKPADILVIHDDLALPLGTIRTRIGGSDGGNNGLKSLMTHLGAETARLRIGVWHDIHSTNNNIDIVLGKFTKSELHTLDSQLPLINTIIRQFIDGQFESTTLR